MQVTVAVYRVLRQCFVAPVLRGLSLVAISLGVVYAVEVPSQTSDPTVVDTIAEKIHETLTSQNGANVGVAQTGDAIEATDPLMLDLSAFYRQPNDSFSDIEPLAGLRNFDGLPFKVDGQVRLFGKTPASRGEMNPNTKKGIRIDRKFDELYLLHHTTWPDVEGQAVAYICLNYADGTKYIFPICYGVHVRDWFNLPSYEKEAIDDPNTMICWRRSPVAFKAPIRIFKSKFENPSPEKVVETMDIVSARNLAAYNLLAATVANRCSTGAETFVGDRKFDSKLVIQVVDDVTGKPIAGALVIPGMRVLDECVVGTPFYTSRNGEGIVPYPAKNTSEIFASVEKKGYQSSHQSWGRRMPETFTFRLKPSVTEER